MLYTAIVTLQDITIYVFLLSIIDYLFLIFVFIFIFFFTLLKFGIFSWKLFCLAYILIIGQVNVGIKYVDEIPKNLKRQKWE